MRRGSKGIMTISAALGKTLYHFAHEYALVCLPLELSQPMSEQAFIANYRGSRAFLKKIDFLVNNPLSLIWKKEMYSMIGRSEAAMTYIMGMIGYFFSLPIRVSLVAKDILCLVGIFFKECFLPSEKGLFHGARERTIALLGSIGECGIACIGFFMPPVAYRMDEWLQRNPTIYAYSFSKWSSKCHN